MWIQHCTMQTSKHNWSTCLQSSVWNSSTSLMQGAKWHNNSISGGLRVEPHDWKTGPSLHILVINDMTGMTEIITVSTLHDCGVKLYPISLNSTCVKPTSVEHHTLAAKDPVPAVDAISHGIGKSCENEPSSLPSPSNQLQDPAFPSVACWKLLHGRKLILVCLATTEIKENKMQIVKSSSRYIG